MIKLQSVIAKLYMALLKVNDMTVVYLPSLAFLMTCHVIILHQMAHLDVLMAIPLIHCEYIFKDRLKKLL